MEKAINQNQSIEKRITNEPLEKPQSLSPLLSPRQTAIVTLIQQTQARRGLPLISVGYELNNTLAGWENALRPVPDNYLRRAYDRAAENWDWHDLRHPFTADAVAQAFTLIADEERMRAAAARRNVSRNNPDTYACWHCCDLGYQPVFYRDKGHWYRAMRACSCEIAPIAMRHQEPLKEPEFKRNRLGEYVKFADLVNYGPPNDTFEAFIKVGEGGKNGKD